MTRAVRHAEFIGAGTARRFLMAYAPSDAAPQRCYLVAPAFAEEMNRSRDALREFALAAADQGAATHILDLRGTGDSPGEFGDYSVDDWCNDLLAAVEDARTRYGATLITLLGIRFGALLAARVAAQAQVTDLLFWQPATEGKRLMREFLRVWSAANMGVDEDARTVLAREGTLEVAGYRIDPSLVEAIDAMTLSLPEGNTMQVHWLEAGAAVSPRSERHIQGLRDAGHDIASRSVDCPPFWRVQERVDATALVTASLLAPDPALSHG
ncbi:MAG: alpha/beta fold hydrolase [Pseudomonadota bacterium]